MPLFKYLFYFIAYIAFPIFLACYPDIFFNNPEQVYNPYIVTMGLVVSIVGIWKHRNNISNLINKKETGLREVLKEKSK